MEKIDEIRSTLPMMITEYGADAYDNTNQREWQNDEQNLGLDMAEIYWPGLCRYWPLDSGPGKNLHRQIST